MNEKRVNLKETFARLPEEWPEDLLPAIQARVRADGRKAIVLDDDPTGTQTVSDVPVLTDWPVDALVKELAGDAPAIYLLTNSRSLTANRAQALNQEIGSALVAARQQSGADFVVISRSDSTLRGHFPGEVDALAGALGTTFDAWLVIPCFPEGGRHTIDDIHYVAEGEWLAPAGQTEFARDKSFGYRSSNVREWVEEKTGGSIPAGAVHTISLEMIRRGGPRAVLEQLHGLPRDSVCVANAVSYRDLEVLVLALLEAEAAGRRYLYRSAASFVRVRAGIAPRPLLTAADLDLPATSAGLVIAGSYVPKTSAQIDALLATANMRAVELPVDRLLNPSQREETIRRASEDVRSAMAGGQDTLVYTSRQLVSGDGAEANLAIGRLVSDSLVAIVRGLTVRPRYLLAKGGITSSDVATLGLGIRRGWVLGQILPGVPVWRSGPESLFPGLAYIVFPGNVGGQGALAELVNALQHHAHE